MFKAVKELFYGFVFLVLCLAMYAGQGLSAMVDAAEEAISPRDGSAVTAPPDRIDFESGLSAPAPCPGRTAKPASAEEAVAGEPATVKQARDAARCWGPACYDHPLSYPTGIPE